MPSFGRSTVKRSRIESNFRTLDTFVLRIWGNSLGGCFAARAASRDKRFAACCVNGGAADPTEAIRQFPRMGDRIGAMLGHRDGTHSLEFVEWLKLDADENRIACPLLVVHGEADPLFSMENAKRLYDQAPSKEKRWSSGTTAITASTTIPTRITV